MTQENSKPKSLFRRIAKVVVIGWAVVLTLVVAIHLSWKYSGSNRWEPAIDQNGVKVYTLKAPGSVVKRIRGVTHVKTTLNAAVESMIQTDSKDCAEWFPGCQAVASIHPWNAQDMSYIQLFRLPPHPPFDAREVLIKAQVSQDPVSKAVLVEFTGMPDELPPDNCCYRLSHMQNSWRFTPLQNGEVEVENRMNVDLGIPYVMFNRFTPHAQYKLLANMQKFLDNDRWRHAKYDAIKEKS
jgi:hypothetical protein